MITTHSHSARVAMLLLSFFGLLSICRAEPVAMFNDITGSVKLNGNSEAPEILSELSPGDVVVLSGQSTIDVIYYASSKRYSVTGPAQLNIAADTLKPIDGNTPVQHKSTFDSALQPVNVATAGLAQGAMVMRGINKSPRLLSLVGTHTLERNPTFTWQPFKDRHDYHLQLTDATGLTLLDTDVTGATYTVPDSITFKENEQYYWYLSTRIRGKKYTSHGDFIVADEKLRAEAKRHRPAADAGVGDLVVYGRYLELLNLQDEANRVWNQVAQKRPDSANIKQRLEHAQ